MTDKSKDKAPEEPGLGRILTQGIQSAISDAVSARTAKFTSTVTPDPDDSLDLHRIPTSHSYDGADGPVMADHARTNLAAQTANLIMKSMTAKSYAQSEQDSLNDEEESTTKPAYGGGSYNKIDLSQHGLDTSANVRDDGRVDIAINQRHKALVSLLEPALKRQFSPADIEKHKPSHAAQAVPPHARPNEAVPGIVRPQSPPGSPKLDIPDNLKGIPKLNVVIQIVGSRGDVQPFIALGQALKSEYGHRVRIATHPTFREFVEENGLEFFSIGGDPAELMAFMVKNPGLMPGIESLKNGDVRKRRKGMYEIFKGCWRSCVESGNGLDIPASDENMGDFDNYGEGFNPLPFVANAIIANPPSFAHIHCAEKLGIPVHLMFTMPWSPTQAFPHPLANIESSNADSHMTNLLSYALVEMMTWQGLGDLVNRFRTKTLKLEPLHIMWAPGMTSRLRVPQTYCWSPALIPKPRDWGDFISLSGFFFLPLATNYTPPPDLKAFLDAGEPPVYIGFGSIVVDDPTALTKLIFEAVKKTGVRALVSKGWGGLGGDEIGVPEGVFMLGNCPHDWLFKRVSCVVHHGGAGTTAAGIATGRPTVVVPFFGDQAFWGSMVARAGAGPPPIHFKQLTSDVLAASIKDALKPSSLDRAAELASKIASEKGTLVGAAAFQKALPMDVMRCTLAPSRVAVWRHKKTGARLSAFAAATLYDEGLIDFSELRLHRSKEYNTEFGPWEPISGGASALIGTTTNIMLGIGDIPREIFQLLAGKSNSKSDEKRTGSDSKSSPASSPATTPRESMSTPRDSISDSVLTVSTDLTKFTDDSDDKPNLTLSPNTTLSTAPTTGPSSPLHTPRGRSTATSPAAETRHGSGRTNSLAAALQKCAPSRSRSRSRNRESSPAPPSTASKGKAPQLTTEMAMDTISGTQRVVWAGLKSPMDFTLALAQGFHNAPLLYGDTTVREPRKVTGFQSGLRTAGEVSNG
jgi:UDP:flavonoid glycosyltransferase YjiC (YdhE family)